MTIRTGRLCTLALISLFSVFVFTARLEAQDNSQPSGSPYLRATTANVRTPNSHAVNRHKAGVKRADRPASYSEEVLYNFCVPSCTVSGAGPFAGVIRDSLGNLYGTTLGAGENSQGVIYEVNSAGQGSTLYSFCAQSGCTDGERPYAGLVLGADGNLYGTTYYGGANGGGALFEWDFASGKESVVYSFCSKTSCADGQNPYGTLIQDGAGNFYGTTSIGGAHGGGTVFEFDASTGEETVLYNFCSEGGANCTPVDTPAARAASLESITVSASPPTRATIGTAP